MKIPYYYHKALFLLCLFYAPSFAATPEGKINWQVQFYEEKPRSFRLGQCEILLSGDVIVPTTIGVKNKSGVVEKEWSKVSSFGGGQRKWELVLPGSTTRDLVVLGKDSILVLTQSLSEAFENHPSAAEVVSISPHSGQILWRAQVPKKDRSAPSYRLIQSQDHQAFIVSVSFDEGAEIAWINPELQRIENPVHLELKDGAHFVNQPLAISQSSEIFMAGQFNWRTSKFDERNSLYVFDSSGKIIWQKTQINSMTSVECVNDLALVGILVGEQRLGMRQYMTHVYRQSTGDEVWNVYGKLLAASNEQVYVYDEVRKSFHALKLANGEIIWSKNFFIKSNEPDPISEFIAKEIDGVLYVSASQFDKFSHYHSETGLYALNPKTGDELWHFNPGSDVNHTFRINEILGTVENSLILRAKKKIGTELLLSIEPPHIKP